MTRPSLARLAPVALIPLLAAGGLALAQAQKSPPSAPQGAPPAVAAQIPAEKEKEIRRLLDASGTTTALADARLKILQQFKRLLPDETPEFWKDFEPQLQVEELIALVIPIYDRHFSLDDLKAINAFFATPAGRRLAEKNPILTQEAFEVGRAWGEAKAMMLIERVNVRKADTP